MLLLYNSLLTDTGADRQTDRERREEGGRYNVRIPSRGIRADGCVRVGCM